MQEAEAPAPPAWLRECAEMTVDFSSCAVLFEVHHDTLAAYTISKDAGSPGKKKHYNESLEKQIEIEFDADKGTFDEYVANYYRGRRSTERRCV